jgi:hypothetical protein
MKLMEFFYFDDKKMDYANDERYSNKRDINVVEKSDSRKVRLTLRQINQLRKNSEAHEFEKAGELEFIQGMYGQPTAEELAATAQ